MAYISFDNLWESEVHNMLFKKDKIQDLKSNQLKLEVFDTYKKDEKISTHFEACNPADGINQT